MNELRRALPLLKVVFVVAVFAIAMRALRDMLSGYRWGELADYLRRLPPLQLVFATMLALTGYLVMTGYDTLAFRYIDRGLGYRLVAFASFTGYAINNNLGLSGVVGTSLRYRFYRRWNVDPSDIARIFVFCTVTYWLGFVLLGGLVFLAWPPSVPAALHLPFHSMRALGALLLTPAAAYAAWVLIRREPLRLRGVEVALPGRALFMAQLLISMADWALAGTVLAWVLPASAPVPFVSALGIFLLAQIAGLVSNVPGGLGVFDSVVLLYLRDRMPPHDIVGALVTFRTIYFLLPLTVAIAVLASFEVVTRLQRR